MQDFTPAAALGITRKRSEPGKAPTGTLPVFGRARIRLSRRAVDPCRRLTPTPPPAPRPKCVGRKGSMLRGAGG